MSIGHPTVNQQLPVWGFFILLIIDCLMFKSRFRRQVLDLSAWDFAFSNKEVFNDRFHLCLSWKCRNKDGTCRWKFFCLIMLKIILFKNCFQGLRAGYPRHALQTILTMSLWDVMKKQYEAYRFKKWNRGNCLFSLLNITTKIC